MTRIAVLSAGLSNPSSTRLLADRLTDRVVGRLSTGSPDGDDTQGGVRVDVIEVRELAHPLADNLLTGFPSGALEAAIEAVRAADALIVVSPVFAASYSGLFKMFFDVLEPDLLRGKPVLLAATAGTARHSLVLEHALRPLFAYLGATTVPTAVFAASEDWGSAAAGGPSLNDRIDRAATELAALLAPVPAVSGTDHADRARPHRWGSADGFEHPVEFTDLLRSVQA
ncbi:FMN reductase [Nakamurella lactea]|uniref:FMN reductase n=1 Tax=Nakamurella lactea TaxID=459515 RepID=UPI000421C5CC|nr:FMN reductase [Nakamurella lactea]